MHGMCRCHMTPWYTLHMLRPCSAFSRSMGSSGEREDRTSAKQCNSTSCRRRTVPPSSTFEEPADQTLKCERCAAAATTPHHPKTALHTLKALIHLKHISSHRSHLLHFKHISSPVTPSYTFSTPVTPQHPFSTPALTGHPSCHTSTPSAEE